MQIIQFAYANYITSGILINTLMLIQWLWADKEKNLTRSLHKYYAAFKNPQKSAGLHAFTGQISGTKSSLKVVAANGSVQIEQFSGEIKPRHDFTLHPAGIHLLK
jgi:hypothetical protein